MKKKMMKYKYSNARRRAEAQRTTGGHSYLQIPNGVSLFRPKAGIMFVDILPYVAGEGNPWAEKGVLHWERTFYVHRGVGPNADTFVCPRMTFQKPCPVCEYRAKLIRTGDRGDQQVEDMIRDLAPKQRQIFNVIDVKEADKGVQVWDISYHLFGKLLDAMIRNSDEDEGWDRFFFLDEGYTLKVGFAEKSFGGVAYYQAETLSLRPRKMKYAEDILEEVHCLDEMIICPDYKELKRLFLQVEEPEEQIPTPEPDDEEEDLEEAVGAEEEEEDISEEDLEEEEEEEAPPPPKKKVVKKVEEKKEQKVKEKKTPPKKKAVKKEEKEEEEEEDWDKEWEELEAEF